MARVRLKGALFAAGIGLALAFPACGKKAPLRLVDEQTGEHAPPLRARIRLGQVTLDFKVPAHRLFPEREEPWVLARVLRQTGSSSEVVEAGAILKADGFAFDEPLTWSDKVLPPKSSFVYRVEFRDAARHRRALSEPLKVSWDHLPDAPSNLTAEGRLRSIVITWTMPSAVDARVACRIYRREISQTQFEPVSPDPVAELSFVDSRIEPDRDYCYVLRAVLYDKAVEVEGPASRESCSRSAAEALPPAHPPAGAP